MGAFAVPEYEKVPVCWYASDIVPIRSAGRVKPTPSMSTASVTVTPSAMRLDRGPAKYDGGRRRNFADGPDSSARARRASDGGSSAISGAAAGDGSDELDELEGLEGLDGLLGFMVCGPLRRRRRRLLVVVMLARTMAIAPSPAMRPAWVGSPNQPRIDPAPGMLNHMVPMSSSRVA